MVFHFNTVWMSSWQRLNVLLLSICSLAMLTILSAEPVPFPYILFHLSWALFERSDRSWPLLSRLRLRFVFSFRCRATRLVIWLRSAHPPAALSIGESDPCVSRFVCSFSLSLTGAVFSTRLMELMQPCRLTLTFHGMSLVDSLGNEIERRWNMVVRHWNLWHLYGKGIICKSKCCGSLSTFVTMCHSNRGTRWVVILPFACH